MIYVAHYYISEHSARIKFFTEAMFSFLALIVVVGQLFIYRQQWHVMERQWKLSREALTKLERPFVYRESISWLWHRDLGRPGQFFYSIRPILANTGRSPTKRMVLAVNFTVRDSPLPDDFDYSYSAPRVRAGIGPNGRIIAGIIKVTDNDLLAIQEGVKHFYVWGKAEYTDLFEGTGTHTTRFCNRISEVLGNPLDPVDPNDLKASSVEIIFEIYGTQYNSIH
jgi:hypothetical protein